MVGTIFLMALGVVTVASAETGQSLTEAPASEATAAADEQFLTAGELLQSCRGAAGSREDGLCLEFIFGLVRTVTEMQQQDPSTQYFCIDPGATSIRTVQGTLLRGLEERQDVAAMPAFEIAIDVLGRAWPCVQTPPR